MDRIWHGVTKIGLVPFLIGGMKQMNTTSNMVKILTPTYQEVGTMLAILHRYEYITHNVITEK